jgi:hypothetical protein
MESPRLAPAPDPTPEEIAARVRMPSRLRMASNAWKQLQHRHAEASARLRELIAEHARATDVGLAHEREKAITAANKEVQALAAEVQPALAAVAEVRPAYVAAVPDRRRGRRDRQGRPRDRSGRRQRRSVILPQYREMLRAAFCPRRRPPIHVAGTLPGHRFPSYLPSY